MQGYGWLLTAVLVPLCAAPAAFAFGRRKPETALRITVAASALTFFILLGILWKAAQGETLRFTWEHFCVAGLRLAASGLPALLAALAGLLWTVAAVFSLSYFRGKAHAPRYAFFTLLTLSSVVGVFVSDQLLTTIVFFEIMGLASYPWVAHEETPQALRAAQTYLWIAVIGGLCLLIGMLLLPPQMLTLRFSSGQRLAAGVEASRLWLPAGLMLVGFAAKAGAFPLHVWLPKAHPVAPAPASALLSGMLLKTGVFGVAVLSIQFMRDVAAWHTLIFWIGAVTMAGGAVLALLSVEMKRILACSSMSQIGFILLGVGLQGLLGGHGGIAAQGVAVHIVNHALVKLLLFLCAGIAAMQSHTLRLSDIRGFGRRKPLYHILFLSAMLSLMGVPYFLGFTSKTLLHESLLVYIHSLHDGAWLYAAAEWLFVLSGALTAAYMLKLYICLFWEQGWAVARKPYLAKVPAVLLSCCAALVLLGGVFPRTMAGFAGRLGAVFFHAEAEAVRYATAESLTGAGLTLGIGLLIYLLVVRGPLSEQTPEGRVYIDAKPAWMDLEDRVYRPLWRALAGLTTACCWLIASLPELLIAGGRRALLHVRAWRVPMPGSNRFTAAAGGLLNGAAQLLNKTVRRNRPIEVDFACMLAAGNEELSHSLRRLKRSMSYSLLLFCVGLFLLLGYLVFS